MEKSQKELEQEKIQLEIRKLNQPWFQNLEFWKVVIPTIAVILSLYFTFGRGIIDFQKEKLSIEKEQLKLEITQFEIRKKEVKEDISDVEKELIRKEYQLKELNENLDSVVARTEDYKAALTTSKQQFNKLKEERTKDKNFYQDRLKKEYQEKKEKTENENKYLKRISDLERSLKVSRAENQFLSDKVNLTQMDSFSLRRVKSDASIKYLDEDIEKHTKAISKIDSIYESQKKRIDTMSTDDLVREFEILLLKNNSEN